MKIKTFACASALFIIQGCGKQPVQVVAQDTVPLYSDTLVVSPADNRDYRTLKLANGIDVILISDDSVDKSSAALSVGVGLLQDPMSQQGMAHYLEHMLFLGTERFPSTTEYSDFMTENGGQRNASTWLDVTNYMFKINNDAYPDALDRFSDFFKAPKLYPEYTDKEKNAVNAEWSLRRELDFFGQFKLARSMMEGHPADRFLIGNLETLGDKEGSSLHGETVAFFEQYYSANIMKVAMLSNRPLDEMAELAKTYFANIENKAIPEPEVTQTVDLQKVGKKQIYYHPNEDVKQLNIEFLIENNQDEFAVKPNAFITYLINSEMPGTPSQILREKGWISSFSSFADPTRYGNYGVLTINVALTDEGMANREEIVATTMQYLNLIKQEGADSKYFEEVRTSLNNQFRFLEKGDEFTYVANLSSAMQTYPVNHVIDAPYYFAKFDEKAIKHVLDQLIPETMKIWYISQQEETDSQLHFYDGKYRIEDINEQEIASWNAKPSVALNLPNVNTLLPENFDIKTSDIAKSKVPTMVIDDDGIKIWRMASQKFQQQPKGSVDVYINNGSALHNIDARILNELWSSIFNQQQVALISEAAVGGVDFSLRSSQGVILSVNGFTDKQNQLIETAISALDISFSEQEFNQAVDRYTRDLANQGKAFPFNQTFAIIQKIVSSGNYNNDALIQRAKALSAKDLHAFIQSQLSNNQVRALAFGNYNDADIQSLYKALKSALPEERTITEFARSRTLTPKAGIKYLYTKDIDLADVAVLDLVIHPEAGYKQKAAAAVIESHFSNTAFEKLRTEEQLAYAVGAFNFNLEDYAAIGLFIQTPVKDAAGMQQRFDEFKAEYEIVLSEMDEDTFTKLKQAALVALTELPKNLGDEKRPIVRDWYSEQMTFDSQAKMIEAVKAVTLGDIKSFYKQTMMAPNAPRVNIELRGTNFLDKPFAEIESAIKIDSVSDIDKNNNNK